MMNGMCYQILGTKPKTDFSLPLHLNYTWSYLLDR